MSRWALLVEYDGTAFVGWQRQPNGASVQAVLEDAAARLSHGEKVGTVAAGRTDAGVHAAGQVVELTLPATLDAERLTQALNYHMKPHGVVVLRAAAAPEGWSARFSAIGRRYRYVILNRRVRPALGAAYVWHVPFRLDEAVMHRAAQTLLGRHDFTSFRAAACQAKSPLRTLDRLDVTRCADRLEVVAEARSFLHHQVRNLVGTLRLVGDGSWPVERVGLALAARDRAAAGPTAPAAGLCLMGVRYSEDVFGRDASAGSLGP